MDLLPIGDRLKVLPLTPPAITKGGLFLPEMSRERPQQGLVLAVGRGTLVGATVVPLECQAGDVVAFGTYAGVSTTDGDGTTVLLMRESEVLGRKLAKQLAEDSAEWVVHGDMQRHLVGDPRCTQCAESVERVEAPEELPL